MKTLDPQYVKELIQQALPDAVVHVREYSGGGDHFSVEVISTSFAGKPRVAQHKMVYAALRPHIDQGAIHALALTTKTKE